MQYCSLKGKSCPESKVPLRRFALLWVLLVIFYLPQYKKGNYPNPVLQFPWFCHPCRCVRASGGGILLVRSSDILQWCFSLCPPPESFHHLQLSSSLPLTPSYHHCVLCHHAQADEPAQHESHWQWLPSRKLFIFHILNPQRISNIPFNYKDLAMPPLFQLNCAVAVRARVSRVVVVMVSLFLVCWGPIQVCILLQAFGLQSYILYKVISFITD